MTIIFFIFGLIIGSFLNAVIYRLRVVESLFERSHCPKCRNKIRWFDNIPILSFLILSAKCRDCGEKISWAYPAVEFSVGAVFAIIGKYFFSPLLISTWIPTFFYLVIFSLLIIIFVYDYKYMEIPMIILYLAVGITILYYLQADFVNFERAAGFFSLHIFSGLLAGILAFSMFFSLSYFSKETWMGMGDAYIGFLGGLLVGWSKVFFMLTLSFTIGALFGLILILTKKKTMKSQIPFAPFLVVGIFLVIIVPEIFPSLKLFLLYF